MVSSLLGLVPDAFNERLRVVRPVLPHYLDELEFRRVKIGTASVDLRFLRGRDGAVQVSTANQHGEIDIDIESGSQLQAA